MVDKGSEGFIGDSGELDDGGRGEQSPLNEIGGGLNGKIKINLSGLSEIDSFTMNNTLKEKETVYDSKTHRFQGLSLKNNHKDKERVLIAVNSPNDSKPASPIRKMMQVLKKIESTPQYKSKIGLRRNWEIPEKWWREELCREWFHEDSIQWESWTNF